LDVHSSARAKKETAMVSRFLTPFGGRPPDEPSDAFLELPHELNQSGEDGPEGKHLATPRLDVYEADGMIEMTAELPGVSDQDIRICLDRDILTIDGEKRQEHTDKKAHFVERSYGVFERSIQLPFAPLPEQMTAECRDGVLTIRFPRVEAERSRKIPIGAAKSASPPPRKAIGEGWSGNKPAEANKETIPVEGKRSQSGPL
jgi:HSP20 family protein